MNKYGAVGIARKWSNAAVGHVLLVIALLTLICSPFTATRGRAQGDSVPRQTGIADERFFFGENRDFQSSVPVGDPLSAGSGAYYFRMPLLALGGPMGLGFELAYRSTDFQQITVPTPEDLPFSFWWSPKVSGLMAFEGGTLFASFQLRESNVVTFKKMGNDWVLAGPNDFGLEDNGSPVKFVLKETSGFFYLMDPIQEQVYIFQKLGPGGTILRIARLLDRNNNQLSYGYARPSDTNPSLIEDGLGRRLEISYQPGAMTMVDQGGRRVLVSGEEVIDALGQRTVFQNRENGLIVSVTRPQGNTPYQEGYQKKFVALNGKRSVRTVSQADAVGNTTTLEYDPDASKVTVQQPDGTSWRHEHFSNTGLPKSITDPTGKTAQFVQNSDRQLTSLIDREGGTTSFTYHGPTGKLQSITNAKGNRQIFTYTAQNQTFANPINNEPVIFTFHNLTRVDYPDGTSKQYSYDPNGNRISSVDRAGMKSTFTYNTRGQVLTITNPAGGVSTFTYNSDATLASSQDSDIGRKTYTYDSLKRLIRSTAPDGSTIQITHDAKNRLTSITDQNNHTTTFIYDANDNLIKISDPADKQTQFAYDQMDRLSRVIDRLGKSKSYGYDALQRLTSFTDATGIATAFGYDPRGWLNRLVRAGHTWQNGYDNEGMLTSLTTPLSNTSRSQFDELGSLIAFSDSLGQSSTVTRDRMQRAITTTDPLQRTTTYAYEPRDLLSAITTPEIGTARFERDAQGLLSRLTDPRGQIWDFSYTSMGRAQSRRDPLGRTWQYAYDPLGRPSQLTFPDSTTAKATYDAASNLIRLEYSGGPDARLTYDALNRTTGADGIHLTYDAEGRVVSTQDQASGFGATYDDAGRLKTATYNNGVVTVTYTYDSATGLLARVSDSLTGAQINFDYDDDFRLTGITRSNAVNTTLTPDKASQLVRIQDGRAQAPPLVDLQYTLDAAGQVTQLNMTAPLNPALFLSGQANTLAYDAASQVRGAGYSYDSRGRETAAPGLDFRWDGDSRLLKINDTTLAYNGLNDLQSRREGSQIIHYFYDYAIYLGPIVAEQNEVNGQFLRYYVWTPTGRLLYMIDAADGNKVYFYHFDRTGSTLALTNQAGEVTDAYAYDPYGQLLAHQGTSSQPFTFVGQAGIRQEGRAGTLYHIRTRYYDATTARFLTPDQIWPKVDDPLEINPYVYASANPIRYVDVTGIGPEDPFGIFGGSEDFAKLIKEMQAENEAKLLAQQAKILSEEEEARRLAPKIIEEYQQGLEAMKARFGSASQQAAQRIAADEAFQAGLEEQRLARAGGQIGEFAAGGLGGLAEIAKGLSIWIVAELATAAVNWGVNKEIERERDWWTDHFAKERAQDQAKLEKKQKEAEYQKYLRDLEEKNRLEQEDRKLNEWLRQKREQASLKIQNAHQALIGQRSITEKMFLRGRFSLF